MNDQVSVIGTSAADHQEVEFPVAGVGTTLKVYVTCTSENTVIACDKMIKLCLLEVYKGGN